MFNVRELTLSQPKKNQNQQQADRRVFLGISQPPLVSATDVLLQLHASNAEFDLSNHLLVLPSSRAVRRLMQLLIAAAEEKQLLFSPPKITTVGQLPEYLYAVEKELATDLAQQIAWAKALRQSPPWELKEIVPHADKKKTLEDWQPIAQLISHLHRRLANDVWSFRSVVREVKQLKKKFHELKRWEALEAIQGRYYELLNEVDLWDMQAARNVAVKRNLCETDRQIVMIGAADLNRATSQMLGQVADNVSVLVAGPRKWADRFDEFGSLITEKWLDVEIKIPEENIRIVDQTDDQAFAAAHYVSNLGDQYSADQITIGIPDPSVVPQIERSLNAIGVKHRNLKGRSLRDTAPVRLMVAVKQYLDDQDYTSLATLVRHPDMYRWLCHRTRQVKWLSDLDNYQQANLPAEIKISDKDPFGDPAQIRARISDAEAHEEKYVEQEARRIERLNLVHQQIVRLLKPLNGRPRSIAEWTKPWSKVLTTVYGGRKMDRNNIADRQTITACVEIYEALGRKQQVPDKWKAKESASRSLQLALEAASEGAVVPPAIPDAIELAGWLDLPLDDAPVMIVTGMNDEFVPASENGHLFLPNSLCEDLGILDNNRRFARDAYATTVIGSVRKDVLFVSGRRDLVGEPRKPSRLLLADSDDLTVAKRANAFFGYSGKNDSRIWLVDDVSKQPKFQQFPIPRPRCSESSNELSVTAFREFIKCPYRFYLSKIMRLESTRDDLRELDGGAFGTLAHDVLEDFARSDIRNTTDPERIIKFFDDRLNHRYQLKYNGSRLPAVRIQIEQLRLRLHAFAPIQARQASEGWKIVSAEEFKVHPLIVDGQPFNLRGTIDRIDIHEEYGKVAVWDYKTSDQGKSPNEVHYPRKIWKDLQLPLYRHLAKEISAIDGFDLSKMQIGFILLPRELTKVGFSRAYWSEAELHEADQQAFEIIRQIRSGDFWEPVAQPPQYSEDFAAICQDNVFERFSLDTSGYDDRQEVSV